MKSKKQYQAYLVGKSHLIGGSKTHTSIWFDSKRDAQNWLSVIKKSNKQANRVVSSSGIRTRAKKEGKWY